MDRTASGIFNKTVIVDNPGLHKVDATLIFEWGQRTIYADRATLNIKWVELWTWWDVIKLLKVSNNAADPSKVLLSWNATGSPEGYTVRYWQSQDTLSSEIKTVTTDVEIWSLEVGKKYFFQVFATDKMWVISSQWSDIASIITQGQSAAWIPSDWPTCTVVGIDVRTEKIGDQYFLIRDIVPWATEYHIYKSDYIVDSIENMQKVWTTTVPQFAYPFNSTAKKNEYTFYSVVATCSDGQNLQIDNIKKVHTWPVSDIIVLLFVSLMGYLLYRIYRLS